MRARQIISGRGAACSFLSQPSPAPDLLTTPISFWGPRVSQLAASWHSSKVHPSKHLRTLHPELTVLPWSPNVGAASQSTHNVLKRATVGRCCCVCPIRPTTGSTKGRVSSKNLKKRYLCSHSHIRTQSKKNPNHQQVENQLSCLSCRGNHLREQTLFMEGHLSLPV